MARERRLFNARLICGRSLRSWRDNVDRTDLRLIIDFERYLNSPDVGFCNRAASFEPELDAASAKVYQTI